jgi:outer membrane receptor protein involved in Fe transport
MRKILGAVAILCALSAAGALAGPTDEFRVSFADGRPVARGRVSVVGKAYSTPTSADGSFRLDPVPALPFEVGVADESGTWLGLIRVDRLEGSPPWNLRLAAASKAEVTVAAGLAPATMASPAAATTVVSRVEMDEKAPSRLADALQDIPGTGRLEEGQSVVPTIRGLARARVQLLVDDSRVTAERRAGSSGTYLDPFVLENVEVVRGPGTVAYGSDALGGVVHARTRLPVPGAPAGGRFALSGEAGGAQALTAGVEASVPVGPGGLLVAAHQRSFSDYESPSGTIDNSSARDRGVLLRALVPVGSVSLIAGVQLDEGRDIGKPSADANVTRAYYPQENSYRFTLGADLGPALGFSSVEVRSFVGRYQLVTDRDRLATPVQPRKISEADVAANDASLRAVATRPLLAGNLRVGFDVNSRYNLSAMNDYTDFNSAGQPTVVTTETAVDQANRLDLGLFLESEQALAKDLLSLSLGLRGDSVTTKNNGGYFGDRSTSNGDFSGFLAVTATPGAGWSVTAQYARGFRDPLLSDRYFRGVSGRGFVVGNPDLVPETSDQFDLAVRTAVGPVRLAAYGFLYRISDLVERYQSGNDFYFRNRGTEELKGAEFEATVDLGRTLSARIGAMWIEGRILDDGSPAGDVPQNSVSLALDWRVSREIWARLRAAAFARKEDFGPSEKVRPGYGIVDLSGGYRFSGFLEARLLVRNLFDKEYQATADALGMPAPGRSATLFLAGRF